MVELPTATLEKPKIFLWLLVGSTWLPRSHPAINSPQGTRNVHDTWMCGWLLPQPYPTGTSQRCYAKCEQWVQAVIHSMSLFCSCWWALEDGLAQSIPPQMLNAIPWGEDHQDTRKTQLLAAWCWKLQARFQKPSKLMLSWQSAKSLPGIKFPLFIFPLQVNSLWK